MCWWESFAITCRYTARRRSSRGAASIWTVPPPAFAGASLADWVGQTARLLRPLVEVVGTHVMSAGRVHADDTTVPVLSPGNGKTKTGRLWCYARDDQPFGGKTPRAVLYCYSPDRKGEHPRKHLAAFKGILQADGYAGYAGLYQQGVTEAACMAHGLGDGSVGGDRVDGHQRAARTAAFRQPCQKNRNGGQRVGFARHRLLTEHEARCGGEGGDYMERCPTRRSVVAAPGRLAVDGDEIRAVWPGLARPAGERGLEQGRIDPVH